jgi:hypothetical protein
MQEILTEAGVNKNKPLCNRARLHSLLRDSAELIGKRFVTGHDFSRAATVAV